MNEIKDYSQRRVDVTIFVSIASAVTIYLIVAMSGYNTYGDEILDDILLNFPKTELLTVARMFVTCLLVFSYPLQLHPVSTTSHSCQPALSVFHPFLIRVVLCLCIVVSKVYVVASICGVHDVQRFSEEELWIGW